MEKNQIRLNRYLALCGLGSRRKCDDLIAGGAIKVNGKLVTQMGVRIDPNKDKVEYYNQRVKPEEKHLFILLNKPLRTVTTASDERRRKTVLDLVEIDQRIFPVGRLDYDTTGALLLTSDGKLAFLLAHPRFHVPKIYRVLLDKRIRPIDLHHFRKGIMLDDRKTAPCKVEEIRILDNASLLEVELQEGRNRQIRRMLDLLGYKVKKLHRLEFAGLRVDDMKTGEWRSLATEEIQRLRKLAEEHKGDVLEDSDGED
jgi:23S rRNA pseudouridine2605 synthase